MAEAAIHQVVMVPAPPDQVLNQVMSVSGADSYKPLMSSAQGVTLQRKRFPLWAILVAIFLFPIGLLALFAREEETVGIALEPVQGGTQVTISGQASGVLQSALHYVLSGRVATSAGLPQNVYAAPMPQQPGGYPPPGGGPPGSYPPPAGGPPGGGPPGGGPPPGQQWEPPAPPPPPPGA
jgi:hypothetical protein